VKQKYFDVIVVGAGHAGTEAAFVASRIGAKTALVTFSKNDLGKMSCNPAMGGLGKGHLIKEIDALGGLIAIASDMSGIQFRVLNQTKGEAVRGPRAQIDRDKYRDAVRTLIEKEKIEIFEDEVTGINLDTRGKKSVSSIELLSNLRLCCKSVIITTGTFLNGLIHCGSENWSAGRLGSKPSTKLAYFFKENNFKIKRLKTGTPPRLISKSINFKKCTIQNGDEVPLPFSFLNKSIKVEQIPCYITRTNHNVHKLIHENISLSPMYNGAIKTKGPRYCPSIEDKVQRFSEKDSHQIFLEPETISNEITYPNGVSTALPKNIQRKFLRLIPGLENVQISKYGYAIEYNIIDTIELKENYESKNIEGLFLAGQINGTTGYEEAAAQGLLSGINAANRARGMSNFVLSRTNAYLGVLTNDIMKGGLEEPYRMFTSRAEYRLLLRADNADERLTDKSIALGLACNKRKKIWLKKKKALANTQKTLKELKASPKQISQGGIKINQDGKIRTAYDVLGYNGAKWANLQKIWPQIKYLEVKKEEKEQLRIKASYEKYIKRQMVEINTLREESKLEINKELDIKQCAGISNEIKEIIQKYKPKNMAEAERMPGMTPAAAALLLRYVKKSR
tara:strand:- start:507 stop:2372 length:1866 start_codon:yes stop_codon:yes gene_type:complete